ncbi:histidine kinase [Fulvivirgaceae bacterium BMA10]|uniref:Histidine kinase n=1 Tax=Splendidivirga corallicola TaxID=3051826 RepID=A0ABT8KXJ6_9BACT|nr:histidine kinase [Fulvivirgaceae bacterium BMA10]
MILNQYYIFKNRFLRHILFWLVYFVSFSFIWAKNGNFEASFYLEFLLLPVRITAVYLCIYFLIPKLLLERKYVRFGMYFLLMLLVGGILQRLIIFSLYNPIYDIQDTVLFKVSEIIRAIILINSTVIFVSAIKILQLWHEEKEKAQRLESDRLKSELQLLKSQVHPHFFFNTLNLAYGLTFKNTTMAQEVLLKMANLMRFTLYNSNQATVPIQKEIEHIQDFIALEALRHENLFKVSFKQEVSDKIEIAPMLLLPFVENAFKHSKATKNSPVQIDIATHQIEDQFVFSVKNSISGDQSSKAEEGGIGIENVKKRLLLLYPDKHGLTISREENSFQVELKIAI